MSSKISDSRFQRQLRIFKNFINVHLDKFHRSIESLVELHTGVDLFYLIKSLYESNEKDFTDFKKMEVRRINMSFVQKANCQVILNWMREKDSVPLHGITAQSIVEKDRKIIMGLVWNIILTYHVQGSSPKGKKGKKLKEGVYEELISWVNSVLAKNYSQYKLSKELKDWESGDALFYLSKELYETYSKTPEKALKIPKENDLECLNECICFSRDEMNIPPILTGDDFKNPDKLTLTTYISFFRNYENLEKKKKLKEEKEKLYNKLRNLSFSEAKGKKDFEQRIKDLEEKLNICKIRISDLETEKERLNNELLLKGINEDEAKNKLKEYQTRVFEKEKIVKLLQENITVQAKQAQNDQSKIIEEMKRKQKRYEMIKIEDMEKNESANQMLKSQMVELELNNSKIKQEFSTISEALQEKEREIEKISKQHLVEQEAMKEKLKRALEESERKAVDITQKFIELHQKNKEEREKIVEGESRKLADLNNESMLLQKKNNRFKQIITDMSINHKKENEAKMELLKSKVKEISLLKRQNEEMLNNQSTMFQNKMVQLNNQSDEKEKELKSKIRILKKMVNEKEDEITKMKADIQKPSPKETAEKDQWQRSSMNLLNKFSDKYKLLKGNLKEDDLLPLIQNILWEQEKEHKKEINKLNESLSMQRIEINGYKEAFKKKIREMEQKHNQEKSMQMAQYLEKIDKLKMKKEKLVRYIKNQRNSEASESMITQSLKVPIRAEGSKGLKKEVFKLKNENIQLKQRLLKAEGMANDRLQIIKALENNYPVKFK